MGIKNRLHRKNAEDIENRQGGERPQVAMNCKSQPGLAWYSDCISLRRPGKTWNVLNRFSCVIGRPSPALCAITFLFSLVPIFHGLPWRFHKQAGEFSMMEWLHVVGNRGLSPIVTKLNHFFNKSRISFSRTSCAGGVEGAAGTSSAFFFILLIPLMTMKITAAIIVKSTNV